MMADGQILLQSPSLTIPWLVYPSNDGRQVFYNIHQHTWEEKDIPWLRYSICMDVSSGWLLLLNYHSHSLSIFQPSSGEELFLPDSDFEINHEDFICRFCSTPPNCYVIAIHRTLKQTYFFVCGQAGWGPKQELLLPDAHPESDFYKVADAILRGDRIYALIACYFAIIDVTSHDIVDVNYLYTGSGREPPHDVGNTISSHVVDSGGQLYEVIVYPYCNLDESPPRDDVIRRFNEYSMRWEDAVDLENRLFVLGSCYSASLPVTDVDFDMRGDLIYFSSEGRIHFFDMHCRGLTSQYHGEQWAEAEPFWLLPEEAQVDQERSSRDRVDRKQYFDHPKCISAYNSCRVYDLAERVAGMATCSVRTPWLMLRQGYGSIIKFVDPCSNNSCELNLPEVDDHMFRYSVDDWIIASRWDSWFFFNPFTREKIDIRLDTYCSDGLAASSAPTCKDCLLFSIFDEGDGEGIIELFRVSDGSVTCLSYNSNLPFQLSPTSPVYHQGLFYCLGCNGNLGIYNPEANTWTVNDLTFPSDMCTSGRRKCYLLEFDSNLLSMISDEYENPIGIYVLDSLNGRWTEIKRSYLEDKTIFAGKETSFVVPAEARSMRNKIYSSKFCREYKYELLAREATMTKTLVAGPFTSVDYISIWVKAEIVKYEFYESRVRANFPHTMDVAVI